MPAALIAASVTTITGPATTSAAVDTTGATLLVVCVSKSGATAAGAAISDSNGNTWHALANVANGAVNTCIFYAYDKSGGPLVTSAATTFTIGSPSTSGAICSAYSGTQTGSDPFDQQNSNTAATSTTCPTGSITPTTDGQVVITSMATQVTATAPFTLNNSYVVNGFMMGAAGAVQAVGGGYIVQGSAAATNPTWTVGAAANIAACIASFKAAGAAPATGGGLLLMGCGS